MINQYTEDGSGIFGVARDDKGIILKVESFHNTNRVTLTTEEVDSLIILLTNKKEEYLNQFIDQ